MTKVPFNTDVECKCCGKNHRYKLILDVDKLLCGVLGCNRQAQTSIREGWTYYNVCFMHSQGHEIEVKENKDYGVEND
jgi:hypothetical protein